MRLGLVSKGLGVTLLLHSYAFSTLTDVGFITLPYKMNLYITWRKNDDNSVLKNILQLVTETAGKYVKEGK